MHPGTAHGPSPADQATVRRLNLALLMRSLVDGGPRSRARLAEDTGLNKATVSSIVGELLELGLVEEGETIRGGPGRPGRVVRPETDTVRFLGIEINVGYVVGVAVDLTGAVRARVRRDLPLDTGGAAQGLAVIADVARELAVSSGSTASGVRSVHVSIPGLVNTDTGVLTWAPNLGWHDIDVVHTLLGRLGWWWALIAVDNDANLGAMGEYAAGSAAGSPYLLYLAGEVGVGGGSVVNGQITRGSHGFAGEVGHMPLGPGDRRCGCGRIGCWETTVGLSALLDLDADPAADRGPVTDLPGLVRGFRRRAEAGEAAVLEMLAEQGRWLGVGVSVLANLLDPEVVVLGGHFPTLEPFLVEPMHRELDSRLMAPHGRVPRVVFSALGFDAASLGAAHAGRDALVADPARVADAPSTR